MLGNCLQSTGLFCFKFSENTHIQVLDAKIASRKKKFGMDYLTLVQSNATQNQLKKCLQDALYDIERMQDDVDDHLGKIDNKTNEVQNSIKFAPGQPAETAAVASRRPSNSNERKYQNNKKPTSKSSTITSNKSPKSPKRTFVASSPGTKSPSGKSPSGKSSRSPKKKVPPITG